MCLTALLLLLRRCSLLWSSAGTHPGYLRALDSLDVTQNEHILAAHRQREERLRNAEEMFVAEMQQVYDEYKVTATANEPDTAQVEANAKRWKTAGADLE